MPSEKDWEEGFMEMQKLVIKHENKLKRIKDKVSTYYATLNKDQLTTINEINKILEE